MSLWYRIEQLFKQRGLTLLQRLLERRLLRPELINYAAIRRILVIRQHDQLGDFLLATPVLRALREHFPHACIAVLARSYTAEVVRHNRFIDEVLVFQEHGWRWTPAAIWRFVRGFLRRWDLAVVLNTVSHSLTSDLLATLSRARYVLGSADRTFPGCARNFLYNLESPYRPGERHQTERNLDIVRFIGVDTTSREEVMTLTLGEKQWARQFLHHRQIGAQERLVVLHLGAGKVANRWPAAGFAELANGLYHDFQVHVLVAWGPKERELGRELLRRLAFEPVVIQDISLRQLAALLEIADGFVCNDTGVMHLGAAVGVPLVAIFGPTDPAQWKPLGEKIIALRGAHNDCANVSVAEVRATLLGLVSPALLPRLLPPEEGLMAPPAPTSTTAVPSVATRIAS